MFRVHKWLSHRKGNINVSSTFEDTLSLTQRNTDYRPESFHPSNWKGAEKGAEEPERSYNLVGA